MITYFISFNYSANGVVCDGNVELKMSSAIKSINDIRELELEIQKSHNYEAPIINNFILLKEE